MLYPVYTTDFNHTHSSKELIGIGTTKKNAIKIAKEHAKVLSVSCGVGGEYDPEHILDKYQVSLLESILQTQGMGECEYVIDECPQNVVL